MTLKNHRERLAVTGFLLLLLSACAANVDQRRAADPVLTAERKPRIESPHASAIKAFVKRLEATQDFQEDENAERFAAARDSLVADVNAFIRDNPHAEDDPDFMRLLNALSALDTLVVDQVDADAFAATEDSMAMANELPTPTSAIATPLFLDDSTFPEMQNSRIDFWITYFTGPGRERFERALYRMELHRPTVSAILGEMGLPQELIALAFIESGFAMKAVSTASAVGPWQFINGTARRYGLRVNWWYDERCDIVASTYAASHYLKDLHGIWGDWFLAFAAYNCGEYRVARQVARQKTQDFWQLDLPLQTERYVPKFLAALYIMRDPARYGITVPSVEPNQFEHVLVTEATDLDVLAGAAGTSAEVLKEMNPALRRGATPPNMEVHVKVPAGSGELAQRNIADLPAEKRVTWREHRVRKGDTLSAIASHYGTSVEALRDTNGMKRKSMLRVGQMLMIPVAGGAAGTNSALENSKPTYKDPPTSVSREAIERYAQRWAKSGYSSGESGSGSAKANVVYTVRRNDTLGQIAQKFGTSASRIRSWNNLSRRKHIYPGQKLKLYVASAPAETPAGTEVATVDESRFEKSRHTVERGETFYSISKVYGVSIDALMGWNGRSRNSTIRPGDVLVIWKPRPIAGSDGAKAPN